MEQSLIHTPVQADWKVPGLGVASFPPSAPNDPFTLIT